MITSLGCTKMNTRDQKSDGSFGRVIAHSQSSSQCWKGYWYWYMYHIMQQYNPHQMFRVCIYWNQILRSVQAPTIIQENWGFSRDFSGFLGISRDFSGFLGISWGFSGILGFWLPLVFLPTPLSKWFASTNTWRLTVTPMPCPHFYWAMVKSFLFYFIGVDKSKHCQTWLDISNLSK